MWTTENQYQNITCSREIPLQYLIIINFPPKFWLYKRMENEIKEKDILLLIYLYLNGSPKFEKVAQDLKNTLVCYYY